MTDLVILVPMLGRPESVRPLMANVAGATEDVSHRLLFLVNPLDRRVRKTIRDEGGGMLTVDWAGGARGDYARKINHGYRETTEPWLLMAASDLCFHPGWASEAIRVGEQHQVGIVGTNDLGNPRVKRGQTSTHPLIRRTYIEQCGGTVDETGDVLHEGYWHNFCDTELVDVAKTRGCFAFAVNSHVEHLHPHWGHGELDATYEHGLSHFHEDGRMYARRSRLWGTRARALARASAERGAR